MNFDRIGINQVKKARNIIEAGIMHDFHKVSLKIDIKVETPYVNFKRQLGIMKLILKLSFQINFRAQIHYWFRL